MKMKILSYAVKNYLSPSWFLIFGLFFFFILHICQTNLVLDKDTLSNYIKVKVLPYEVFKWQFH